MIYTDYSQLYYDDSYIPIDDLNDTFFQKIDGLNDDLKDHPADWKWLVTGLSSAIYRWDHPRIKDLRSTGSSPFRRTVG